MAKIETSDVSRLVALASCISLPSGARELQFSFTDVSRLVALASCISLPSGARELQFSFTKYLHLSVFGGSCLFLMPDPGSENKSGSQEYWIHSQTYE